MGTQGKGQHLVLPGSPGSGKGAQARLLVQHYGLVHFATGDLLRKEVAAATGLGKATARYLARGDLVPNDLVLQLVRRRLTEADAGQGFVLDGFPRRLSQARALVNLLAALCQNLTAAIRLAVSDDVVVDRLAGRLVCLDCGAVYHAVYRPPNAGNVCPACRTVLHLAEEGKLKCEACSRPIGQREDDRPEVVRARLAEYHRDTGQMKDHCKYKGLLSEVDAIGNEGEVFERLQALLGERVPVP